MANSSILKKINIHVFDCIADSALLLSKDQQFVAGY